MIILFAMKLAKTQRVVKCFPKQLFGLHSIKTKLNIRKAFKVTMIKKKLMLETQTLNYPPTHEKREETKRIYKVIRNDVLDVVETFQFFYRWQYFI